MGEIVKSQLLTDFSVDSGSKMLAAELPRLPWVDPRLAPLWFDIMCHRPWIRLRWIR
jgi:hypothetical protein